MSVGVNLKEVFMSVKALENVSLLKCNSQYTYIPLRLTFRTSHFR